MKKIKLITILALSIIMLTLFGGILSFAGDATGATDAAEVTYANIGAAGDASVENHEKLNTGADVGTDSAISGAENAEADADESVSTDTDDNNAEINGATDVDPDNGGANAELDSNGSEDGTGTNPGGESTENGDNASPDNGGAEERGKNPFTLAFLAVKSYSSEILSALAFIGSLIIALAYRRGLMPIIKNALSAFSDAITKIKESQTAADEKSREANLALKERLELAENTAAQLKDNLEIMTARLYEYEGAATERESMRIIMLAQIDMLYEIFMTSALPQYEKDAVGERIQKMKEALERVGK